MSVLKIATSAMMAMALVAVPTLAQAAPVANKLSVSAPVARTGARTVGVNKARGGTIIIAILAVAAVVAGIVIAADNNNNPTSA
jgi:hypothetical protein